MEIDSEKDLIRGSKIIIVIGVPRSGTTLLRTILDCHTEIAGAPETPWITGSYGDISLREIYHNMIHNELGPVNNLSHINNEIITNGIYSFISHILNNYSNKQGKKRIVLKTPNDIEYLEFLTSVFKDAKYIHITRDGRDVARSTITKKGDFFGNDTLKQFGDLTIFNSIKRWHDWEQKVRLHFKNKKNYLNLFYENLVRQPAEEIKRLTNFIGINYEPEMLEYSNFDHDFPHWEAGSNDVQKMEKIDSKRIGLWKNTIPYSELVAIDNLYGDFLEKLGYQKLEKIINADHSDLNDYVLRYKKLENENQNLQSEIYQLKDELDKIYKKNINIEKEIDTLTNNLIRINSNIVYRAGRKTYRALNYIKTKLQRKNQSALPDIKNAERKHFTRNSINLKNQADEYFGNHRSGWSYAVKALENYHCHDGIYLDTFIERTFSWDREQRVVMPIREPWIGIIHVPSEGPEWFLRNQSNSFVFNTDQWKASLKYCQGIFTLSMSHRKALEKILPVSIDNLIHPTSKPLSNWSPEKFLKNNYKKIVQVGWWLRILHSIFELPESNLEKVFLKPRNDIYFKTVFEKERQLRKAKGFFKDSDYDTTTSLDFVPDREYDSLLSENIVFINLYATSANNAIIECIQRCTPILVNPLESVKEYLGNDYPFYFTELNEAVEKANSVELALETHEYLKNHSIRNKLKGEYFAKSLITSPILSTEK